MTGIFTYMKTHKISTKFREKYTVFFHGRWFSGPCLLVAFPSFKVVTPMEFFEPRHFEHRGVSWPLVATSDAPFAAAPVLRRAEGFFPGKNGNMSSHGLKKNSGVFHPKVGRKLDFWCLFSNFHPWLDQLRNLGLSIISKCVLIVIAIYIIYQSKSAKKHEQNIAVPPWPLENQGANFKTKRALFPR